MPRKNKAKRHNERGFTLLEMLLVVAILVVLFSLAMIPIARLRRDVRQTELDSRAEMIFMAVQNRLTQLQAAGRSEDYQTGTTPLGLVPMDAEEGKYDGKNGLVYVTSAGKTSADSAAARIYPEDGAEPELWNGSWVVEFDAESASVYAVFFSDGEMNYTPAGFNSLRYRSRRLQDGARVGYYGGDSVGAEETGELDPTMEIVNAEQLYVRASCATIGGAKLSFYITVTDEDGNSTGEVAMSGLTLSGRTYTAMAMLDDLSEGEGLRFGEQGWLSMLTPGQDLTVTVRVEDASSALIDDAVLTRTTNSLFAGVRSSGSGRTAIVKYGRHLQNLDRDSGLGREMESSRRITGAVQEQDIQFASADAESWSALYPGQNFTPIRNELLKSYDSTCVVNGTEYHPVIYDLPVETAGDAGLFEFFGGTTTAPAKLSNIRLAGASVRGAACVGGLVGKLSGAAEIAGCQVYLSSSKGHLNGKTEQDVWLYGSLTGGLVGDTNRKNLTITDSLAATVVYGANAAGGLAGRATGTLRVTHSYADCYVSSGGESGMAGGLVGTCSGTATIELRECYAAGFLRGAVTGGLTAGELSGGDTVRQTYSACAPLGAELLTFALAEGQGSDAADTADIFTLSEGSAANQMRGAVHVEYSAWSGTNRAQAAARLGPAFTAENGDTSAYNLMEGMGLTLYSYPKLSGLPHYGDWQTQFESGSLVYYEKYADGSYGFYGANVSTLVSSAAVPGDGYGMIYGERPTEDVTVMRGDTAYTLSAAAAVSIEISDRDGAKTYYLLPLPSALVQNAAADAGGFYTELTVEGRRWYYNPHFANTAVSAGTEAPKAPEQISIRTARQLYALSEYYEQYADILPRGAAFLQGCDIRYESYDWAGYGRNSRTVTQQRPIGRTDAHPFVHTYDGGGRLITGISFVSEKKDAYVGLFGRSSGELRSIVVTTAQPLKTDDGANNAAAPTAAPGGSLQGKTAYIGVLAGWNGGTIYNCAVSGYRLTGYAYSGTMLYLGGLVGYNAGSIRASSASTPLISGTSTYARGYYVGGFAGGSRGQIRECYALASIEVLEIRGSVYAAGFVAENHSSIRTSYCATALNAVEGATIYGFASPSGSVTGCRYLNGGTYTFAGEVHLYDYTAGCSGAAGMTDSELAAARFSGFSAVDAAHSPAAFRPNTETESESTAAYPYPGVVTGRDGSAVHYGDWVTAADLGTMGIVYWEEEVGGANSGYHFSYLGFDQGVQKSGSSLCTAHDDGGAVRSYGYAYYWRTGEAEPQLTAALEDGTFVLGGRDADAERALAAQTPGFTFVAYRTAADGMHLESDRTANGTWTLTQSVGARRVTYSFTLCPFFADAYALTDGAEPGSAAKPYAVRSVEQLQFLNWSFSDGTGSVSAAVTTNNYRTFPYLQYTTVTTDGEKQTKEDAAAGTAIGGPRPIRSWVQSHDLNGSAPDRSGDWQSNTLFYPIAGAVNNKTANNYSVTLFNWFGGSYDGQSYYIKNIRIDSYCYNVGLFGSTAGAAIRNIVLYSDNASVIRRSSSRTPWSSSPAESEYVTSYALGGLVGIAYDYTDNMGNGLIENCAIAGYKIQDNSQNKLALGEAAVGGLVGVSRVNLKNCSAVADIEINCTHFWKELKGSEKKDELNAAAYGNFVRVGGLVGGLRYRATNCYTGGSIVISDATLSERVLAEDNDRTELVAIDRTAEDHGNAEVETKWAADNSNNQNPGTYVFVGGVGGSGFSANFTNFTGTGDSVDGHPSYENCYTYMELPDVEGTICGVSIIGSLADRYGGKWTGATLTVRNCYYLDTVAEGVSFDYAAKSYISEKSSLYAVSRDSDAQAAMLRGDLRLLGDCLWSYATDTNRYNQTMWNFYGLTPLTYAQMSDRVGSEGAIQAQNGSSAVYSTFLEALNSNAGSSADGKNGFGWVTVEEDDASIHGKYSFPGSDASLRGQNYPFPTVLTSRDTLNRSVNLHYGAWPKVGLAWSDGIVSIDLIADYDGEKSSIPLRLLLNNVADKNALTGVPEFTFSSEDVVRVTAVRDSGGEFDVVLEGLTTGAVEVTAKYHGLEARLMVTLTAVLNVSAEPAAVEEYVGEKTAVRLTARDKKGAEHEVTWIVSSGDEAVARCEKLTTTATAGTTFPVLGVDEGETLVSLTAIFRLASGLEIEGGTALPVTVSRQGVLGIANAADGVYREGVMNKALSGWETEPADCSGEGAPAEAGSTVFLYFRGRLAALDGFDVTAITVTETQETATGGVREVSYDVRSDASVYGVQIGSVAETDGGTYRPITLRGAHTGTVTLSVTLTDRRDGGADYTLQIPVTLTEQDTQLMVCYEYPAGTVLAEKTVTYGTAPGLPAEVSTVPEAPEGYHFVGLDQETGWSPDVTAPVYESTSFAALLQKNAYTVRFLSLGEEAAASVAVKPGESITGTLWPAEPEREGYRFLGWTPDGGVTVYDAQTAFTPEDDAVLSALWRRTVDVQVTYRYYDQNTWTYKEAALYGDGAYADYSGTEAVIRFTTSLNVDRSSIIIRIDGSMDVSFDYQRSGSWPALTYTLTVRNFAFPADEY